LIYNLTRKPLADKVQLVQVAIVNGHSAALVGIGHDLTWPEQVFQTPLNRCNIGVMPSAPPRLRVLG
jgi:hypothetical protein